MKKKKLKKALTELIDKVEKMTGETVESVHLHNIRHSTPISDKANVSTDSEGDEDLGTWIYELGLLLDKKIPLKGLTNAQRIEIALREYCG